MGERSADHLAEALRFIEKLVSFPTESSRSNLELIDWMDAQLRGRGASTRILPNADGDKAALFATFGPPVDGGVLLSGHSDVVPVAGQVWSSDPFTLRRADGRLYGRGACDMKGFVGAVLAMAEEFQSASLRRPIHVLVTYDEETTCLGPVNAIARFGVDLPRPGCVIVGEPTLMRVGDSHRGIASYLTSVFGTEAHSSRPDDGVSAIHIASELIVELYRIGAELASGSSKFDPPGCSVSVGVIRGGAARNIVAGECSFEWEFRCEPDLPYSLALRMLDRFIEAAGHPLKALFGRARIETRCEVEVPGLRPEPGNEAETLAFRLMRTNTAIAVPFATEAGRFQASGLPVAICGPGSIRQAHQPDEFIEIAQIEACLAFLRSLAAELAEG